ncbi:MAG: 50S ribosomal protein L11 methyltransferase [Candidatus Omnitrophota bacterium]
MKKALPQSDPYSVIEIALCGRNLRPAEKELALKLLRSCRILEHELVFSDYKGVFRVIFYTRSMPKIHEIQKKYKAGDLPLIIKVKSLGRRDWFDKWKRDYHIGPLGAKFMIVPFWERRKFKASRRSPIFLEPGSAFGSGYHETTRLMVRLLESLEGRIGSFLDIGCGTGILSVAVSKLGARKITGYDNDKPSALVAGENFRKNQCENGTFFCAQLKRSKVSGHFDTVGANLISKVLLEYREKIVARVRPGGHLLVSGISHRNFPAFKREFTKAPLKCLKILRGRSWAAVLYKKVS